MTRSGFGGRRRRAARLRPTAASLAAVLVAGAGLPAAADAHGLVGGTTLPIPQWLFAWAAAIVLIASFFALALLWPRPRLQQPRLRRVATIPRGIAPICELIGVAVFAIVVYCAFAGTSVPLANLAPTVVYVAFWVGVPVLSVLLGDVFRPFNPWRAIARWFSLLGRLLPGLASEPMRYPERLGRWPATAGIVAFAWVELVYVDRDDPATLGVLMLAFAFVQVIGISLYGDERWSDRADPFGVWFGLCARISVWETRGRELCLRAPLSGLPRLEVVPGTVALLCVLIGTTTFDGASNGVLWVDVAPKLQDFFGNLGLGATAAGEVAFSIGLALAIAFVSLLYWAGVRGMRTVEARHSTPELARRFVHTLVPIAFAYALAHYFSLLIFQGQALGYLVSDPLGHGSDLFGTADGQVDYGLISATAIWYVQVAALVAGHVGGLVLAHDRALAVYRDDAQAATRSQYWMLTVMVGFTCLGLWLLSAVNT
ncbi:MAG: fenitrothion hydrolase protein FedB [Conexibacter sp.]|nr:fenitrothion hydrolase protein FedB [Conexibacter sp.]